MDTTPTAAAIPLLPTIAPLAAGKSAWLVDIWGVMHNGVHALEEACAACARFRREGGIVLLVSNAPRPEPAVIAQLEGFGVPGEAYDGVVSSGDVTRAMVRALAGRPLYHLGPERDVPIFEGLDVTFAEPEAAEIVVCTGLWNDDEETPEDYRTLFERLLARGLPMICANPDVQVERGERLVYCGGALARAYEAMGGRVEWAGKPFPAIYERVFARLAEIAGRPVPRAACLAIGDGIETDIKGAVRAGVEAVYIPSAVHMQDADGPHGLEDAIAALFRDRDFAPRAALPALRW